MTTEHYDDPMAHNVLETTRQAVESNDLSIERPAARKNAGIKRTSRVSLYVRRYMRRPSAVVGLGLLLALILWAMFGRFATQFNYVNLDFAALSVPPFSEGHIFGTTDGGADVYAMVVHGLGRSLLVAFLSSILTTIIDCGDLWRGYCLLRRSCRKSGYVDSRHAAGCSIHLAHRYFGAFGRWNLWLAVAHLRLNCFRLGWFSSCSAHYRYEYSRT